MLLLLASIAVADPCLDHEYTACKAELDQNPSAARATLAGACDGGSEWSCWVLGGELWQERDPMWMEIPEPLTDDETAMAAAAFRTGCELGDGTSCRRRGIWLRFGIGGTTNLPEAVVAFEDGCAVFDQASCTSLAYMLARGMGVFPDPQRADRLLQNACGAGHAPACLQVAGQGASRMLGAFYGGEQ